MPFVEVADTIVTYPSPCSLVAFTHWFGLYTLCLGAGDLLFFLCGDLPLPRREGDVFARLVGFAAPFPARSHLFVVSRGEALFPFGDVVCPAFFFDIADNLRLIGDASVLKVAGRLLIASGSRK